MCHSLALDLGTPPLPTSFRPSHPSSHCRPAHKRLIQPPRGLEEAISIRVSSCFFASVFHPDPNLSVLSLLCHLGIRVIRKKERSGVIQSVRQPLLRLAPCLVAESHQATTLRMRSRTSLWLLPLYLLLCLLSFDGEWNIHRGPNETVGNGAS